MKKIGICTLYFANNFGAILQAFALQETLLNMGYDVEFIKLKDFAPNSYDCNLEKFNYSKQHLKLAKTLYDKNIYTYDAIIIGSDEMWNLANNSFEHLEEYFGYNFNCSNIISYAPSANKTSLDYLKSFYNNKIKFENFNNISVRDKHTQELVREASGRTAELVLDPTLLLENFDKYIKFPEPDLKDYIIIYGYSFTENEIKKIKDFAKNHNKKIYSIGFVEDWCETLNADIFEFLGYLKNADYIITTTFHGLLFSMILEKEFAVFSNNNPKIDDIIDRFKIHDRDAKNIENLENIFSTNVNYNLINQIKQENRIISLNYLKNSLN